MKNNLQYWQYRGLLSDVFDLIQKYSPVELDETVDYNEIDIWLDDFLTYKGVEIGEPIGN